MRRYFAIGVAVFGLFLCAPAFSQVSAFTAEMDRRLQALAGGNALNCGAVTVDGNRNPQAALRCARRAIARKSPFYVRADSWGMDSFLSDGFAADGGGKVYYVEFDSLGWTLSHVETNAEEVKQHSDECPQPVRIRRIPWRDHNYVAFTCMRKKRGSDDPHEW